MVFKLTEFLAQELKMTHCRQGCSKSHLNKEPKLPIMLLSDQAISSNFISKALATFSNRILNHSDVNQITF